jgi:hypothetical protein
MRLFEKTRPSYFLNFIFIFSRPGQGFKNLQKNNLTWVSKRQFSNMWYQSVFKAGFCILVIRNYIMSKVSF